MARMVFQNGDGKEWCHNLNNLGASEDFRKQYQTCAKQQELLASFVWTLLAVNVSMFKFGSSSEGTNVLCYDSDIDIVLCNKNLPVIINVEESLGGSCFIMVHDSNCRPGYVKLQLVNDRLLLTDKNHTDSDYKLDSDGRWCIDHEFAYELCPHKSDFTSRSGPAFTTSTPFTSHEPTDVVPAFRCSSIPPYANDWLSHYKTCCWPPRSYVDKLASYGCLVVPVGHPHSSERDLEWRISFSLQERDIMFSLNPIQHKCYIFLKVIKRNKLKPELGDAITSYHLKTSLFHLMTKTSEKFWSESNLVVCVRLCMLILLTWVNRRFCPNFFTPKQNLFQRHSRQVHFSIVRYILHKLVYFSSLHHLDVHENVFCNPTRSTINDMHHYLAMCHFSKINVYGGNMFNLKFRLVWDREFEWLKLVQIVSLKTRCPYELFSKLSKMVNQLRQMVSINHTDVDVCHAKAMCTGLLLSLMTQCAMSFVTNSGILALSQEVRNSSSYSYDAMSVHLVIASAMYTRRLYRDMNCTLDYVLKSYKSGMVHFCRCNAIPKMMDFYMRKGNFDLESNLLKYIAPCVTFTRVDVGIIPEPLHLELVRTVGAPLGSISYIYERWFFCSVVDARVFLYFLKYRLFRDTNQNENKMTVFRKLKNVVINAVKYSSKGMIRVLKSPPSNDYRETEYCLGHLETAWNLLGWIYVQEGELDAAVRCFTRSWRKRRNHNAAKWHVAMLMFDTM